MKTTTTNQASILTTFTPEQLAALSPEQLAALANVSIPAALDAPEVIEAPQAPAAPKAPKPAAPAIHAGQWVSYRDEDGIARMCKIQAGDDGLYVRSGDGLIHINDASEVQTHDTQGQALQRRNALAKAEAPTETAPEAPKPEPLPEVGDPDRAARVAKRNAAIIATMPQDKRRAVQNKLTQLHKAGYPYARLATNKHHQLDGLHIYPGAKGHGRDEAFKACTTQQAQKYRAKADKARAEGKPAPKPLAGVFVWSPVGGGNLYARGIFGPVTEA